ncbi:MAG: hypothetical protein HY554_00695 [Elusimicrobia bacterium]|nr:hypothetical protein [Elusimicrobiota bacterium]
MGGPQPRLLVGMRPSPRRSFRPLLAALGASLILVSFGAAFANLYAPVERVATRGTRHAGLHGVSIHPNPFDSRRERAIIGFSLGAASEVKVTIVDVAGRAVRRESIDAAAGSNRFAWDGADDSGAKVAMGVYACVIQALAEKQIRKIGVIH